MASNDTARLAALRHLAGASPDAGPDEELLRRFCADRDEAAFAIIVRRHGGLVLDVCRSVLRNDADAEDAFQATFVTLAADARRIRRPAALASWLHAVAWRVSAKARRTRERRRIHEAHVSLRPDVSINDPSWGEVREGIHEEVNRLPDRFRAAIVLFYLAGRTQDEVAQVLGLSTAGAKRRLERGRAMLRAALDRRGFGPTVALAAAAIALPLATAAQTAHAADLAVRFLTDRGTVPAAILSLVSSGVQPMTAKLIVGAAAFLGVASAVGFGALRPGDGGQPGRDDSNPVIAQVKDDGGFPGPKSKSPPKFGPSGPGRDSTVPALERFRQLEPSERLKLVEKVAGGKEPFAAAKVGDIVSTIVERGSVEAARTIELSCKVKAKDKDSPATSIKWLIDDGSMVKKGDRIGLLDDSALRDQLVNTVVKLKEAEATRTLAAENLQISKTKNDVDIRLAAIEIQLAEIELKEAPKGKSKLALELKVEQAKLRHERVRTLAKAEIVVADAELRAKSAVMEQVAQQQKHIEAQLAECVITAPMDGIVTYYSPSGGRFGAANVVSVGEMVREGQRLLQMSDLKEFVIQTNIHEAIISRLRVGQTADVRVDAFPGKLLKGKITHISPVAAKINWNAADVKVYPVKIAIEDPPGLKPSMSAEVQITTGDRKAVLHIPIQAIVGFGRDRVCFVKSGNEIVERKIVTGMGNLEVIEVKEGLKEGDLVLTEFPNAATRP